MRFHGISEAFKIGLNYSIGEFVNLSHLLSSSLGLSAAIIHSWNFQMSVSYDACGSQYPRLSLQDRLAKIFKHDVRWLHHGSLSVRN